MTTQQIQKKKKKEIKPTLNKTFKDPETLLKTVDATILAIDEKYLAEFKEVKATVKSIIIKWAEELETKIGMHPNNISTHITEVVRNDKFCHEDYVRHCLKEKYKNLSMSENANAGGSRTPSTKICPHCHLAADEDPTSDSDMIWEIPPQEYTIEDLHQYNRNFLVQVVLEQREKITQLETRLSALEAELKA